jgi:hypothetical protein
MDLTMMERVCDRKKWKDLVRQAEAHSGLQCQWKKKKIEDTRTDEYQTFAIFSIYLVTLWARITQSVQRLATGSMARESNPGMGKRFSALVQTGAGAHPASYTTGTGASPWGKGARTWR